jgi:hypothetical protein
MSIKVYTAKSSAARAAKKLASAAPEGTNFTVDPTDGGWKVTEHAPVAAPQVEAPAEIETTEEVAGPGAVEFGLLFAQHGGTQPRGICKALRAIATEWTGSRKEFLEAASICGLNVANAAAEWQVARKK